ncbi:hypothetical protein LOAG_07046 [Loa loa]|uniref:MSP domain-containing protein n=1 Tax=Loa loa TaxID=7209 RepID=A0A1S0TX63_LOALO|nr:hypothetical protein LOAG_07046 [Loa loa]EFO21444.2 hypothetical protein LOAG_07046 [Loa loa]
MNEFCIPENPPVHNLIFSSEDSALNSSHSEQSLQTALKVTEINGNSNESQLLNKLTPRLSLSHNSVKTARYRTINFALDRFHEDVAYVQLKLVNNSKRQVVWKLKTNNKCITALPSGKGLVPAFRSGKCILSWQIPKDCQSWIKVESAKLLISIRIYTAMGKLLGEDNAKYIGKTDNLPTHQIVLVSEKVCRGKAKSAVRTFVSTERLTI